MRKPWRYSFNRKYMDAACTYNRPRSIYQYSNMAPTLSGQTSIFGGVFLVSKSLLGIERQKKLNKLAILTWKPGSNVRILISRTWPIVHAAGCCMNMVEHGGTRVTRRWRLSMTKETVKLWEKGRTHVDKILPDILMIFFTLGLHSSINQKQLVNITLE